MAITYTITLQSLLNLSSNDYPALKVHDIHRDLYDYDFDALSRDMEANGISKPLTVVNGALVDGHHRAIVAKELEFSDVPITYSGYLHNMP
jgi:ParB-like chromosome segregation protein Spo0J